MIERSAADRRASLRRCVVRRSARHGHLARRSDRDAGAQGRVRRSAVPTIRCVVGSVKTNLGHLEAAAGVAGTDQGGAVDAARRDSAASPFQGAQPAHRARRIPGDGADGADALERTERPSSGRRQLVRVQRHECASGPRGSASRAGHLPRRPNARSTW